MTPQIDLTEAQAAREPEVIEEHIANLPTGLEAEQDGGAESENKTPWNPDDIRVNTKTFSLRHLLDLYREGSLDLVPDFQRRSVWKPAQRCGLIESILLGIPLPALYFNENLDGLFQVIDGVQRLSAARDFASNTLILGTLAYLKDFEGKTLSGLPPVYQRRFYNTQLIAHVIDPRTPYLVKFDIFKRINTGGTPLSPQEIRHAMSGDRSRDLLQRIVELPEFQRAFGKAILNHPRMADRELALRLILFLIVPYQSYDDKVGLEELLGEVTNKIDSDLSKVDLDALVERARLGLSHAEIVFKKHAFRKWPMDNERLFPINRALVESWGTALSSRDPVKILTASPELQRRAREMMRDDQAFNQSITNSTGDTAKVKLRMERVEALVAELVK